MLLLYISVMGIGSCTLNCTSHECITMPLTVFCIPIFPFSRFSWLNTMWFSILNSCVVWERSQYRYMLDCHKLVLLCCTNCTESVSLHGLNLFLFVPFIWNVTINVSVVSITINPVIEELLYLSVLFVL